ncbi:MAG: glycerate kinase [Tessaracoccus sp.]|uniref:glycerate kinase n=1 Tax=Tessaracoccus sp. TaxID=1971211 RepID=UPI001ECE08D2|nr:glycerate kinase [Tessaracoccus sp.]MBK7819485.1 glycerate kinase [Tessaracoccus sp.]
MRVVVACDATAGLSPRAASEAVAGAFAREGATVAVVTLGAEGATFREALAVADPGATLAAPRDNTDLFDVLRNPRDGVVVDLTGYRADDLGRAALLGLGPDPRSAFDGLRVAWSGLRLSAVVPEGEVGRPLTGLSGLASTAGRAEGLDLSSVLAADAAAEAWAAELGVTPGPGAGAAWGAGLLFAALGADLAHPLALLTDRFGLARTVGQADVVVTGAESLDFHAVGGPVVKHMVALAGEALRPAIAVVGRNFVSSRELRLVGIESAYPAIDTAGEMPSTPEQLGRVAARVASTWRW